jgi:hypothetical protein
MDQIPQINERDKIANEVAQRATLLVRLSDVAKLQNENISALSNNVNTLAEAVKKRPTTKQVLAGIVALGIVIIIALSSLVYVAIGNHKNSTILVGCTTPKHACYNQSQTNSTNAVQDIKNWDTANRCDLERFEITLSELNGRKTLPLDSDCRS